MMPKTNLRGVSLFAFAALFAAPSAFAACGAISTVTGTDGLVVSFSDARTATAGVLGAGAGRLVYDATAKQLKLCDGDNWVTLLNAATHTMAAAGTAVGQIQYRDANGFLAASDNLVWNGTSLKTNVGGTSYSGWGVVPYANLPANDLDLTRGNSGSQTAPYRINYHTGLSLSAHTNYGGIRLYNQGYSNTTVDGAYRTADGASMVMALVGERVGIRTTSPVTALSVNGIMSGGIGTETTGGSTNWNDISNARSGSGRTLLFGSATNGPGSSIPHYFYPFSFEYNKFDGTGNLTQFAVPYGAPNYYAGHEGLYIRSRYQGTWGSWRYIPMQAVSDYSLKENVTPLTGGLDAVMRMKPVHFTLKDKNTAEDGFIAHELAEIAPYAVTGKKDEVDESGTPRYQNVDYGRITPLLVQAIQEMKVQNDALRLRIEALEGE